jgi:hypothetical protein
LIYADDWSWKQNPIELATALENFVAKDNEALKLEMEWTAGNDATDRDIAYEQMGGWDDTHRGEGQADGWDDSQTGREGNTYQGFEEQKPPSYWDQSFNAPESEFDTNGQQNPNNGGSSDRPTAPPVFDVNMSDASVGILPLEMTQKRRGGLFAEWKAQDRGAPGQQNQQVSIEESGNDIRHIEHV